jgi:hypothetical protein
VAADNLAATTPRRIVSVCHYSNGGKTPAAPPLSGRFLCQLALLILTTLPSRGLISNPNARRKSVSLSGRSAAADGSDCFSKAVGGSYASARTGVYRWQCACRIWGCRAGRPVCPDVTLLSRWSLSRWGCGSLGLCLFRRLGDGRGARKRWRMADCFASLLS